MLATGCVTTEPLSAEERDELAADSRRQMFEGQEAVERPLTLADATARAIKYQAEHRQRRMEETRRQIEAETQRALEQIRAEVAELTLIATERVTGKVLSGDDQRRLIDEAISGLDFSVLEKVESR